MTLSWGSNHHIKVVLIKILKTRSDLGSSCWDHHPGIIVGKARLRDMDVGKLKTVGVEMPI